MIITHPGSHVPPVCGQCEGRFLRAQHASKLLDAEGVLHLAELDPLTDAITLYAEQARLLYKGGPHGEPNGLVQDGLFKGWWAHGLRSGESLASRVWLLARPNYRRDCGPIADTSIPFLRDQDTWFALSRFLASTEPSPVQCISGKPLVLRGVLHVDTSERSSA